MYLYHYVDQKNQGNKAAEAITFDENLTFDTAPAGVLKQQRLAKAVKEYSCALDFDHGFLKSELKKV